MKRINWMNLPRIFIIEDSMTDCLLMTTALQQAGYSVSGVTDGREGLALVLEQPPHCLILDIILPGINGYTICRQIRTVDPQHTLPIIVVSTKSSALDENYALRLGADRYLPKPFTAETLVQTVWEVLPEQLRSSVALARQHAPPQHRPDQKHMGPELRALIPSRRNEGAMMWVNNPFAGSTVITDKHARRLYAAIDGRKTVTDLCTMMQLDLQSVQRLLKTLWDQQHIAFCDQRGQSLEYEHIAPLLSQ